MRLISEKINNKLELNSTILASIILLLFFVFVYSNFSEILIFTEAREYIKYQGWINDYSSLFARCFFPSGENSRTISMLNFHIMKNLFQYNHVSINLYQIGAVIVAGFFLWLHGLQVFKNGALSALAILLWLFSLPMVDALCWQATFHDKIASAFVFITLVVSYYYLKLSSSITIIFLSNTILFALVCLSYNSKESSFFIMPLILSQYLLFSENWTEFIQNNLKKLILPLIYSIYFIVGYFYKMPAAWQGHALSNSSMETVSWYAGYLLNDFDQNATLVHILFSVTILLPIAFGIYFVFSRNAKRIDLSVVKLHLYCYIFFLLSVSVALKAKYPSPYYMLLPLSGYIFLNISILLSINRTPVLNFVKIPLYIFFSIVLLCVLKNYIHLYQQDSSFMKRIEHSDNMKATYQKLSKVLSPSKKTRFILHYRENSADYFYMIRSGNEGCDSSILNFVFQEDGDYKLDCNAYAEYPRILKHRREDEYNIILDKDYNLLEVGGGPHELDSHSE